MRLSRSTGWVTGCRRIDREVSMRAREIRRISASALFAFVAVASASAADKVTGTFTAEGQTIRFAQVYASLERAPADASRKYLTLLVADVPVAPADRAPDRLPALAKAG